MSRPRGRTMIAGAICTALAAAAAGCGISDPVNDPPQTVTVTEPATPTSEPAPAGAREVLARFGQGWSNWTADSYPRVWRGLAELATGELQSKLLRDAGAGEEAPGLESSIAASKGRVDAVVINGTDPALVLVTHELAHTADTVHAVYRARAIQTIEGWRVSEWVLDQ